LEKQRGHIPLVNFYVQQSLFNRPDVITYDHPVCGGQLFQPFPDRDISCSKRLVRLS
jgi:hypothetical protein